MAKKASSIDLLPEDIRRELQRLLDDPRVTQLDATAKINAILAAEGHDDRVSKSAVNRYAVRMEAIGKRLRESRQISEDWVNRLGTVPEGQMGQLLLEMVRTLAFEAVVDLSEDASGMTPKMIKDLAVGIERLEKAASENQKREAEIRKAALQQAAEAIDKAAAQQGLNADQASFWRQQVLGVE